MSYNVTSTALKTLLGSLVSTAVLYGWTPGQDASKFGGYGIVADCRLDGFVPTLPSGQSALTIPTGIQPEFIGLAFGVQNYTCTTGNNFTNVGAVAELIDISCYVDEPWFDNVQDELFPAWDAFSNTTSIQQAIEFVHFLNPPTNLAQHYFVTNPTTGQGVSPKWDFTSNGKFQGNSDAFFVGKGNGTLPSPDDPKTDVAWLEVLNVQGKIADEVFRVDTVGGQPPSSCVHGTTPDISVNYVSKYIFYGGSLN